MIKRFIVIAILICICVAVCGCGGDSANDIEARKYCNFKILYKNVDVGIADDDKIYVDTTTGVMYIRSWMGGISPLYNADGTLKIWNGEINGER